MKWQFSVPNGSQNITLNAELIYTTFQVEQVKVTGKGLDFTVNGNRLLIEGIDRPHPIPVTWKMVAGEIKDQPLFAKITKAVEEHLKKSGNKKERIIGAAPQYKKTA
jgi:hypothetical protein